MSVLIETTIGDLVVDLFCQQRPKTCANFLKLCKIKYYNLNQIFKIEVFSIFIIYGNIEVIIIQISAQLYSTMW